jgi:MFS family permease
LAELSCALNGFAIVCAALLVPGGRPADLHGRKGSLVTGMSLFVLASASLRRSPVVGRPDRGTCAARRRRRDPDPSSLGVVLPAFAPQRGPSVIAACAAVSAVGAAAGPPLGGLLPQASMGSGHGQSEQDRAYRGGAAAGRVSTRCSADEVMLLVTGLSVLGSSELAPLPIGNRDAAVRRRRRTVTEAVVLPSRADETKGKRS